MVDGSEALAAERLRRGDADATLNVLSEAPPDITWISVDPGDLAASEALAPVREAAVSAGRAIVEAARAGNAHGAIDALGSFRVNSSSGATLELVGSARGAHIQGVVMNSDPIPVSGVWVTLIPEDSKRDQKRLFNSVRSQVNGKFEFRGVAPGNYTLFSWDNIEENEWDDPEFLKPFKSKGVSVRVAEGKTKTADLTVIRTKNEAETKPR